MCDRIFVQLEETQRDVERLSAIAVNENLTMEQSEVSSTLEMGSDNRKAERLPGLDRLATTPSCASGKLFTTMWPGEVGLLPNNC